MSTTQDASTLVSLVEEADRCLVALGLPERERTPALKKFLAGPVQLAIIGPKKTGKTALREKVQRSLPSASVEEALLRDQPADSLWDVVLVVTPADMALSQQELQFIRSLHAVRRPIMVVVTRVEVLGNGQLRRSGEEEIARFRLMPTIGPLGVKWHFHAEEDDTSHIEANLREMLAKQGPQLHGKPALDHLAGLLLSAADRLTDMVAQRDLERASLREVEGQYPMIHAHLLETAKLAQLRLRDESRLSEQRLSVAASAVADGLGAWVVREGLGDIDDSIRPFLLAWKHFNEEQRDACTESMMSFIAGAQRATRQVGQTAERLGIVIPQIRFDEPKWLSLETEDALKLLTETKLQPVLDDIKKRAQEALEVSRREKDENIQKMGRAALPTPSLKSRVTSMVADKIETLGGLAKSIAANPGGIAVHEFLRNHLLNGLEATLRPRLIAVRERASHDIEMGTATAGEIILEQTKVAISEIRLGLEQRYAWSDAHAALLRLADTVDEARRGWPS